MKRPVVTILSCLGLGLLGPGCTDDDPGVTDECPDDPDKLAPGTCGCNVPDVDANGNGTIDCVEVSVNGTITATWTLVSGDFNVPTTCPAGATTAALYAQDALGQDFMSLFNCADGAGTADLPAGDYVAWIQLTDDTSEILYAQSPAADVAVVDGADTPVGFDFSIDRGAFTVEWEIHEGGAASDCAATRGTTVLLESTDAAGNSRNYMFPCTDYTAMSPGLPVDSYTVRLTLLNAGLVIAATDRFAASIDYGNHSSDLGTVILDVPAP